MSLHLLAVMLGCGEAPSEAVGTPAAVEVGLPTRAGLYRLQWSSDPSPVPFNTLFAVKTVLLSASGAPVQAGTVVVDARMPQHGHGMPTHPVAEPGVCTPPAADGGAEVCTHPDGVYTMSGMKMHMQGEWVIHFDVTGPAGNDSLDVHYTL